MSIQEVASEQDMRFIGTAENLDDHWLNIVKLYTNQKGGHTHEHATEGCHLNRGERDKPQSLDERCWNHGHVCSRVKLCGNFRNDSRAVQSLQHNVNKGSGWTELQVVAIANHWFAGNRRGLGIRTTCCGSSDTRPT